MVNALTLLLPCLFPSWTFFSTVEPSPRVHWRATSGTGETQSDWVLFRPRPAHLSAGTMLRRLLWNPGWNETLYLVSLSERVMLTNSAHSVEGISRLIATELGTRCPAELADHTHFQFRLEFVHREGRALVREVGYVSAHYPLLRGVR